jgi:CHAD domain-containing protein
MAKRSKRDRVAARRGRPRLAAVLDEAVHDPTARAVAASAAVAAGGALAAAKIVRDRALQRAELHDARRYRLLPGERVADGVRRIARGQLDVAIELLEHSGTEELTDAVHSSRMALKRLRALVRLARDALGEETYRRENEIFREAGRELSAVRDAQVTLEALEALATRFADELSPGAFAGLHDALSEDARSAHERLKSDPRALAAMLETLKAARDRVATWPLHDDAGLQVLASGFERIYRRGRRALRTARRETSTEHLHTLRKRAKDLWHGAQVMRPAAPKMLKKLGPRAHHLADLVGEDHDLAVLLDRARERAASHEPGELELLTLLVDRRRRQLQRRALRLGRRTYARKPRKLTRRVSAAHPAPG